MNAWHEHTSQLADIEWTTHGSCYNGAVEYVVIGHIGFFNTSQVYYRHCKACGWSFIIYWTWSIEGNRVNGFIIYIFCIRTIEEPTLFSRGWRGTIQIIISYYYPQCNFSCRWRSKEIMIARLLQFSSYLWNYFPLCVINVATLLRFRECLFVQMWEWGQWEWCAFWTASEDMLAMN